MKRFWAKVDVKGPDDCWPWTGCVGSDGYGHFRLNGKIVAAHRVAADLGPDEHGLHECDNTLCCNPKHIQAGTHQQNMADCARKGRSRSPRPGNGHLKIPRARHDEIRQLFATGLNKSEIARRFNVTPPRIRQILQEANHG